MKPRELPRRLVILVGGRQHFSCFRARGCGHTELRRSRQFQISHKRTLLLTQLLLEIRYQSPSFVHALLRQLPRLRNAHPPGCKKNNEHYNFKTTLPRPQASQDPGTPFLTCLSACSASTATNLSCCASGSLRSASCSRFRSSLISWSRSSCASRCCFN